MSTTLEETLGHVPHLALDHAPHRSSAVGVYVQQIFLSLKQIFSSPLRPEQERNEEMDTLLDTLESTRSLRT
jgi:hypothetical protein